MERFPELLRIVLARDGQQAHTTPVYAYRFAGGELESSIEIQALSPWAATRSRTEVAAHTARNPHDYPGTERIVFSGWIAEAQRRVAATWHGSSTTIEIDGVGRFDVEPDTGLVRVTPSASVPHALLEQALFGPPLILQLAARDTWCLHASAVELEPGGGLVLFVGDSGCGKSTMARWLSEAAPRKFGRITDDITPVAIEGDGLKALPVYPQPKLEPKDQYDGLAASQRSVRAVVWLDRSPDARTARLHCQGEVDALLTVAGHTVSSRLFSHALLKRHLSFCREASRATDIFTLEYGSGSRALGSVCDLLDSRPF